MAVHLRHLKFKFKVRDGAKAADYSARAEAAHKVHGKPVKRLHPRAGNSREIFLKKPAARLKIEKRPFARVSGHGNDDLVEEPERPVQDVEMAVCDWVERSGVDRYFFIFLHFSIVISVWGGRKMPNRKVLLKEK